MLRVPLPTDPSCVGLARQAVRQACAGRAADVEDVVQCTSELVTNALLHGSPPLLLEALATPERLRIAVHDAGAGTIERREPLSDETLSGRGLGIVAALASRWGSDRTPHGKVAWFEVDERPA